MQEIIILMVSTLTLWILFAYMVYKDINPLIGLIDLYKKLWRDKK